jgi:uncharacterized membrane protein
MLPKADATAAIIRATKPSLHRRVAQASPRACAVDRDYNGHNAAATIAQGESRMNEAQDNSSFPNDPTNPYRPPGSAAAAADAAAATATSGLITDGRRVPAGNGSSWLGRGWSLFKEAPGMWIVITLLYFVMALIINLIPIGGIVFYVISPVLLAGLMLGCDSLAHNDELELSHLFAGFQRNAGSLLLVGLLYLAGLIAIIIFVAIIFMFAAGGTAFTQMLKGGELNDLENVFTAGGIVLSLLLTVLIFVALLIPLMMAYWFAPALVVFHKLEPLQAMKMSFMGCLKNFVPFLVYGLLGLILAIVASIPLMLGWLVAWPMFIGSLYASYRDIYLGDMGPPDAP